jgi:hypothetical protein
MDLPGKQMVTAAVKKIPDFYGIYRLITVSTHAHHSFVSCAKETSPNPPKLFL